MDAGNNIDDSTARISLSMDTKEKDSVECPCCSNGILIPCNPEKSKNYSFYCNNCGIRANIDPAVAVE